MTEPVPVLLVRLLSGVVGDSRRTMHIVPCDDDHIVNVDGKRLLYLKPYCGVAIMPKTYETFDNLVGMPCELCAIARPIPHDLIE